jgi:hypothetical protein
VRAQVRLLFLPSSKCATDQAVSVGRNYTQRTHNSGNTLGQTFGIVLQHKSYP